MTTKEELDEAIKYIEEYCGNAPEILTALTILTKYRDGELVEKSKLAEKLDFELSLLPRKFASEYEDGISLGISKAIEYLNELTTPPTNQTEP